MTEAEGEAVLMALGPQLEWNPYTFASGFVEWHAEIDGDRYCIMPLKTQVYSSDFSKCGAPYEWFRAHILLGDDSGIEHTTFDAAKAAYECHHATGKWQLDTTIATIAI